MGRDEIEVPDAWEGLVGALASGDPGTVLVLGESDTGKSTLVRFLADRLEEEGAVWRVDGDPGQASLGPPAALTAAPGSAEESVALRFVGSVTPTGHFLQTLTGLARLAELALDEKARYVLVDLPGYSEAGGYRELLFQVGDLLRPPHLISIQEDRELEEFLTGFEGRHGIRIHRLEPAPAVQPRSRSQRRRYREERFRQYFQDRREIELSLDAIGLHGMVPGSRRPKKWQDLLVAPCDEEGFALALGVVREIEPGSGFLKVEAPPFPEERIVSLQAGSLRLDPRTGEHRRS
ncbi:MAG: Clp1/GlmU family protein [Thermoanaerobaculia bacterium]|nr:Clp1/GlmU family protein [Thermoanaerobaculia bacterium]